MLGLLGVGCATHPAPTADEPVRSPATEPELPDPLVVPGAQDGPKCVAAVAPDAQRRVAAARARHGDDADALLADPDYLQAAAVWEAEISARCAAGPGRR